MSLVFLIRKREDGKYLNQKEDWSNSIISYRLKEFNSEEEATAAIPKGIECTVVKKNKVVPSVSGTYYLQDLKTNLFLNVNSEFKASFIKQSEIMFFKSEDDALDKAEALGLDLNLIRVMFLPDQFLKKNILK